MPLCLNAGIDWKARAAEKRRLAEQEPDPDAKAWLNALVKEYERWLERTSEETMSD